MACNQGGLSLTVRAPSLAAYRLDVSPSEDGDVGAEGGVGASENWKVALVSNAGNSRMESTGLEAGKQVDAPGSDSGTLSSAFSLSLSSKL